MKFWIEKVRQFGGRTSVESLVRETTMAEIKTAIESSSDNYENSTSLFGENKKRRLFNKPPVKSFRYLQNCHRSTFKSRFLVNTVLMALSFDLPIVVVSNP